MTEDKFYVMMREITERWSKTPMDTKIPYSKNRIEKAGKILTKNRTDTESLKILYDWREVHVQPLSVMAGKLKAACSDTIIVQRVKRLDSILGKLERNPGMNLYRMQDLGGCRLICNSMKELPYLEKAVKQALSEHTLLQTADYIKNPKTSGYRGIHLIYNYGRIDDKDILIEVQLRTRLQHIWATSVEIMGIYTKEQLKSGLGNEDVLYFFVLVSSLFAIMENTPVCPDMPEEMPLIVKELKILDEKLNIISRLSAAGEGIRYAADKEQYKSGYYVMQLDFYEKMLHIQGFSKEDIMTAVKCYEYLEKAQEKDKDTVLVRAESFEELKAAYPNYFVDINEFIKFMRKILG